jgi:hypothetical protein
MPRADSPASDTEGGKHDDSEEALEAALAFARAIIDGEVAGLTVDDL